MILRDFLGNWTVRLLNTSERIQLATSDERERYSDLTVLKYDIYQIIL
jgi:hypothetical protein